MVCKTELENEGFALCVVRDFSGTSSQNHKVTIHATQTMTVKEFVQEVAKQFNFEPCSFRLVAPTPNKKNDSYQAVLIEENENLLKDVGVMFEGNARNLFIVEGLNGSYPRLMNKEDDLELGASASPEEPSSSNSCSPPLYPPRAMKFVPKRRHYRRHHRSDLKTTEDSFYTLDYRGLVNQAMTCYLNSLLQALFMTPEFRNALYNWKFVPSSGIDESKSIPYQLQRLFLNLQTSPRPAVETTDLTRSFGWDSSEAWQQHDIQELCRVMFDALEQEFKGTEQADLINRLYQGKMIDYVKCQECGTEKSREDMFLDIPLPVRPFGSTTAYGSVEEALTAFVQPEMLEGNNQYFCEKCNRKCNAHKGLKFVKFPYLLTLHLMRFDFDYNTMHRIKLSDKVVFPETLNLNSYVPLVNLSTTNMYKEDGSEGFPEESSSKCDDSSTTDSGSAIDDENCMTSSNDLNNVDYDQDIDEGIDVSNQHENENKNRYQGMETGPYIYELFSIMVHSGSASGGHYYVYIKDFNTGEWICFNDQTVTKITNEDIDRSFGGYGGPSRGYYSGVYSSSMNAYMLMYRQIDRERNVLPLKEHEFPPHITALLREMSEKAESDRRMRESEKEVYKIKVYLDHPSLNMRIEVKIDCNSSTTLKELTQIAYKKLELEKYVTLDQCRLVVYNEKSDAIESSMDGVENEGIYSYFGPPKVSPKIDMLMEIRQPNVPFQSYKLGAVPIKVHLVDLESEQVLLPMMLRVSLLIHLPELRELLYHHETNESRRSHEMLLILDLKCNAEKFLEDETVSLQAAGVGVNSRIFLLFKKCDMSILECRKKMRQIVKSFLNSLRLTIVLPDIKPDVFKMLSIPSLSEYYSQKQGENVQTEKDACYMNGDVLGHQSSDNPTVNSTPPTNEDDSSSVLSNDLMNLLSSANANSLGGHRSDQSASEDSSLTDSDRTIIGDTQEDYQISSPSSSPQGCDVRYSNDLLGEDESCATTGKTSLSSINDDGSSDAQSENYHFKEICNNVTVDKKNVKIEVDKRMPMTIFKKYLEQYVQVPSPYFSLCSYNFVHNGDNGFSSPSEITSLEDVGNYSSLHVRLERPPKPGSVNVLLYLLNLHSTNSLFNLIGRFNIDENSTVADTKRELLQDLRIIYKIDIPFERCRLRKQRNEGPGEVCRNEQTWKELRLKFDWRLMIEELGPEEPIENLEARYCVVIRHYPPVTGTSVCSLRQIVFNEEFTLNDLKTKISEKSGIPVENLVLGELHWCTALRESCFLSAYISNSDIDWDTINECPESDFIKTLTKNDMPIICYKHNREDTNEVQTEKKVAYLLKKRDKTLTIRVNRPKASSFTDENHPNDVTGLIS